MKYAVDQSVILLDTEYTPTVSAVVKAVNQETQKYLVAYQLRDDAKVEEVWVPQDRLSTLLETIIPKH